jgi:hypothetical protein
MVMKLEKRFSNSLLCCALKNVESCHLSVTGQELARLQCFGAVCGKTKQTVRSALSELNRLRHITHQTTAFGSRSRAIAHESHLQKRVKDIYPQPQQDIVSASSAKRSHMPYVAEIILDYLIRMQ